MTKKIIFENLKLPLCPKCFDTKNIKDLDPGWRTLSCKIEEYDWYECPTCQIRWSTKGMIPSTDNSYLEDY